MGKNELVHYIKWLLNHTLFPRGHHHCALNAFTKLTACFRKIQKAIPFN